MIDDIQNDANMEMTQSLASHVHAAGTAADCTKAARHSCSSRGESSTSNYYHVESQGQRDNSDALAVSVGGTRHPTSRDGLIGKLNSRNGIGNGRRARTVPPVSFPTTRSLRMK